MIRTLYEVVAEKTGIEVSVVIAVWRHYCMLLQRYMSSPVVPEILVKHFGKFQLSTKDIDKKKNTHRNIVQSEYRQKLRELSLKLTFNTKYDNNELSS